MTNESTPQRPTETPSTWPEAAPPPPAARDADVSDVPPAPAVSGKGPMDQMVPDVATGSTPVTRRDD